MVLWRLVLPAFVAITLPILVSNIGSTWSARLGGGVAGTFTASRVECDRSCSWYGDFAAADGSRHRVNVLLGSGAHIERVGQRVAAVDTDDGKEVYPRGGGWDWLYASLILLAELIGAAVWLRWVYQRARRLYPLLTAWVRRARIGAGRRSATGRARTDRDEADRPRRRPSREPGRTGRAMPPTGKNSAPDPAGKRRAPRPATTVRTVAVNGPGRPRWSSGHTPRR
jgi:hypothetical protein